MPVIDAQAMTFSRLYYTGRFEVPWHQRFYDWKKEHVHELLHDLQEAVDAESPCYFLGTIMLVEKATGVWVINDGQQRMVTISLLCARLCKLFEDVNDSLREMRALRISFDIDENSTVRFCDADTLDPRLTPHRDDETNYTQLIQGESIGSNGKLALAWQEIDDFVSAMDAEGAQNFLDFLIQHIEVTCLYVPTTVDTNAVFETINSRGKQLEGWDLIRNYLYSYLNDDRDEARRRAVHANLERTRTELGESKALGYAHCYFQYQYGFLPKGNFYKETRKRIRAAAERHPRAGGGPAGYIHQLVADLSRSEYLNVFRTITNPRVGDSFIGQFHTSSRTTNASRNLLIFLKELQTYTVTQTLVFALLSHYVTEPDRQAQRNLARDIHSRLHRLTSFVMRTAFVLPQFRPSSFEEEFAKYAHKIRTGPADEEPSFEDFLRQCDTIGIIEDTQFVDKMERQVMFTDKKIKRLLLGLNHATQRDAALINDDQCTIEHILPQSDEYWQTWTGFDDPPRWVNRIGNLTLLGQADNTSGDWNRTFRHKRRVYQQSAIALTRELAQYTDWSPTEVDARQASLIHQAVQVWSF